MNMVHALREGEHDMPEVARKALIGFADQLAALTREIKSLDRQLRAWHQENPVTQRLQTIPGVGVLRGAVAGLVAEGVGEGWLLGSGTGTNHTSLGLYRIRVVATARYDQLTAQTLGVTFEKVASFAPTDIEPGATGFYDPAGGLTWDATDDGVIFQVRVSHSGSAGAIYTVKWREDAGIVWKMVVPSQINFEGPFFGQSWLLGQRWALMRGNRVIRLDTSTGAVVSDETWPAAVTEGGVQLYDAVSDTLLVRGSDGWARLFLGRGGGGGGEALATIVGDLCGRAGLDSDDLDLGELDAVVPGYVLGRQTTVRGAIQPLAQAFFFDAIESDDVLDFRKHGRAPVATIPADHLLPLDERTAEIWRERRTQEVELPERLRAQRSLGRPTRRTSSRLPSVGIKCWTQSTRSRSPGSASPWRSCTQRSPFGRRSRRSRRSAGRHGGSANTTALRPGMADVDRRAAPEASPALTSGCVLITAINRAPETSP
jgi:hypothetical protein